MSSEELKATGSEELPELVESSSGEASTEKEEGFSEVKRKRKRDTSDSVEPMDVKRPSFPPVNVSTSLVSQKHQKSILPIIILLY